MSRFSKSLSEQMSRFSKSLSGQGWTAAHVSLYCRSWAQMQETSAVLYSSMTMLAAHLTNASLFLFRLRDLSCRQSVLNDKNQAVCNGAFCRYCLQYWNSHNPIKSSSRLVPIIRLVIRYNKNKPSTEEDNSKPVVQGKLNKTCVRKRITQYSRHPSVAESQNDWAIVETMLPVSNKAFAEVPLMLTSATLLEPTRVGSSNFPMSPTVDSSWQVLWRLKVVCDYRPDEFGNQFAYVHIWPHLQQGGSYLSGLAWFPLCQRCWCGTGLGSTEGCCTEGCWLYLRLVGWLGKGPLCCWFW